VDLGIEGKRFLLVGGTAGMGKATAECLVAEGARVAVVGRDRARAADAAAALGAAATAVVGDITRRGEAERIVAEAAGALGGLDGVAVTTGLLGHTTPDDSDDDIWAAAVDDVLMGTVRTVRAAVPHLVTSGGGTIVTTGAYSTHAYHPARLPYVTLKSAVVAFTKVIARAYGSAGIRANCLCPGAIETGGLAHMRQQLAEARGVPPEGLLERVMVEEWHMDVALGRPGRPHEAGELYAFLLSARAGYLSGAVINLDGGTDF
jgi:3-oxoacyl-[acyl-carrier protein] reductase